MELNYILQLNSCFFKYHDGFSLENISFKIKKGEFVGILGRNGAGKSTLFNLISGNIKKFSGDVLLNGKNIREMRRIEISQTLTLMSQKHSPLFPYKVREFLMLGRSPYLNLMGKPTKIDMEIVEKYAKMTGVYQFMDKPYTNLSGGEMQLVLLTRALIQTPSLLLLDEPNLHLDFRNHAKLFELLKEIMKSEELTILVSLHDPNYLINFSDRAIILENGKLTFDDSIEKLKSGDFFSKLYEIEIEKFTNKRGRVFFFPKGSNQS